MIGSEEYQHVPSHLQSVDPYYKQHHYTPKKDPNSSEIIESLINDSGATAVKMFNNVASGTFYGTAAYAVMRYFGKG